MYLYCYRRRPNFGDALNDVLWSKFIDVRLEKEAGSDEVFVGIGTLLNEHLPVAKRLHIFGTGLGYGSVAPESMRNWEVHFVRGPLTAKSLSLDPGLAISDPAILIHRTEDLNRAKDIRCSFMPHHSLDSPRFRELCQEIDINYISPELPCDQVMDQLLRSEKLICSAMHGAIAAEALRIPWLPVVTHDAILESKWHDWAGSLEISVEFVRLPTIYQKVEASLKGRVVGCVKKMACKRQLKSLARSGKFQLGSQRILEDRLRWIEEKIADFNARFA
jgi:succinoglycan biosynthesis protein ExoV